MVRIVTCVAALLIVLATLHADDTKTNGDESLARLHEQRCTLLRENLSALEKLARQAIVRDVVVEDARLRLLHAEAEAAIDNDLRRQKQDEVLDILKSKIERVRGLLDQGITPPSDYREAQLRLVETQIKFRTAG